MPKLNKIILVGNIQIFDEKMTRSEEERQLDVYTAEQIVYPDLVFTLKHKKSYLRPLVRRTKNEFQVISNPLFFKAAKEAGLEEIKFDLLMEGDQIGGLIEDYHLRFPDKPELRSATDTFLFFNNRPSFTDFKGEVRINPATYLRDYQDINCVRYSIPIKGRGIRDISLIESGFLSEFISRNGELRSVDGLIKKFGVFKDYF